MIRTVFGPTLNDSGFVWLTGNFVSLKFLSSLGATNWQVPCISEEVGKVEAPSTFERATRTLAEHE